MDAARFQNLRLDTRSRSTEEGINPSISALTEGFCPSQTRLDSPGASLRSRVAEQASEKQGIDTSRALQFSVSTNTHKGSLRKDALRQSPFPKRVPQTTITQFTLIERERAETPTIQLTPSASSRSGKDAFGQSLYSAELPHPPSRNLREGELGLGRPSLYIGLIALMTALVRFASPALFARDCGPKNGPQKFQKLREQFF